MVQMYYIVFLPSSFRWHIGYSQFLVTQTGDCNKREKDALGNMRSSKERLKDLALRFLRKQGVNHSAGNLVHSQ